MVGPPAEKPYPTPFSRSWYDAALDLGELAADVAPRRLVEVVGQIERDGRCPAGQAEHVAVERHHLAREVVNRLAGRLVFA
jgi:hypothetical protein